MMLKMIALTMIDIGEGHKPSKELLKRLSESVEEMGIVSPITVKEYNEEDKNKTGKLYKLLDGYARCEVAGALNILLIPAIIVPSDFDEEKLQNIIRTK